MKKVIFVGHSLGRSGTSAMTGALVRCGACAGNVNNVKSIENPTGFFEMGKIKALCKKYFGDHIAPLTGLVEPVELLKRCTEQAKKDFFGILESEFGGADIVVMKAMGYCPIPLLRGTRIDVRVVCMHRNPVNQARSIERMWYGKPVGCGKFEPVILKHEDWLRRFKAEFSEFGYIDVGFEDLLLRPVEEISRVCDFCGLEVGDIKGFINPKYSRSS